MKRPRLVRFLHTLMWTLPGMLLLIATANWWMLIAHRGRVLRTDSAPAGRGVALVLGTAPTVGGVKNRFFEGRMDAAAQLWRAGKVRHLLLSGDNSRIDYDEPTAMRDALIARGLPEQCVTRDYAGFRTLDSLVRAREVFGLRELIIVTDDWHQPRALFLADAAGVDALGVSSADVPWSVSGRTRVREWLSRVKALADVWVLRTKPKYLGDLIKLPVD